MATKWCAVLSKTGGAAFEDYSDIDNAPEGSFLQLRFAALAEAPPCRCLHVQRIPVHQISTWLKMRRRSWGMGNGRRGGGGGGEGYGVANVMVPLAGDSCRKGPGYHDRNRARRI